MIAVVGSLLGAIMSFLSHVRFFESSGTYKTLTIVNIMTSESYLSTTAIIIIVIVIVMSVRSWFYDVGLILRGGPIELFLILTSTPRLV